MRELSLHILDIAGNSVAAGASNIDIDIDICTQKDTLIITIRDDGRGMDSEMLAKVQDPFTTTRQTRKVGMGLPLLGLAADMSGGGVEIESKFGNGTTVTASFKLKSVNRVPMGNLAETILTLTLGAEQYDLSLSLKGDGREFQYSTRQIKQEVGYENFQSAEVLQFLQAYLQQNIFNICGGIV